MKRIIPIKTTVAALVMAQAIGMSYTADAAMPVLSSDSYFAKKSRETKSVRPYRGQKLWSVEAMKNSEKDMPLTRGAVKDPKLSFEDLRYFDYLEGPQGQNWFYTATYEVDRIVHSEWYVEELITGYTFDIYDENFNHMGSISDKVKLQEGETKVASAVLDPAVSRHFFNSDDNIEVMVFIAVNTEMYTNKYYNKIYSVGGEKDAEGNDVNLLTIEGRCVDAVNVAADEGREEFYYTFAGEEVPGDLDADYEDFVEFLNSYYMPITTYAPAVDNSGIQPLLENKIYMTRIPGDTTDGIYVITKPMNGKLYIYYSQYEKPYFIDPTGMASNEEATPDNSLIIDSYVIDGNEASLISTTKIPVVQETSSDQLIYSFYNIGSVAWKNDVDVLVNGSISAPAFLVSRDVMNAATYEEVLSTYSIYDNAGNIVKEIASNTDGIVVYDVEKGKEPDVLFIYYDETGAYHFLVKGLYTGNERFSLLQDNNGDPISASCNRFKAADGSYKYAFEMSYYELSENNEDLIRVAWFNEDGTFDHIDKLNMGQNVMAGSVNLYSDSLNPYIYDDDDAMEYAVLVKRIDGATTKNEFIVVDDNGEWYAHFTEEDGKGLPFIYTLLPGDPDYLMMVYDGNDGYNVDFYTLPFTRVDDDDPNAGVEDLITGSNAILFNNDVVIAQGCDINVFATSGVMSAQGRENVSIAHLPAGVYMVVAVDAKGHRNVAKIYKK